MWGLFRHICLICLFAIASSAQNWEQFPQPKILEDNIEFWKRIYSELNSNQVIFTDQEDLTLVYRVVKVPKGWRARKRAIKRAKKQIKYALKKLHRNPKKAIRRSKIAREIHINLKKHPRKDKYKRWRKIRAQGGLKDKFKEGYIRAGAYEDEILARLNRAGLPEQLIGIACVESLFHPKSHSSRGAKGIWQFMRRTAWEFMRVNRLVDERLDPVLSTEAAIKYIQSAQKKFSEWPIIITSYNYGRNGMVRIVKKHGTEDFTKILKRHNGRRFKFAARNYYAEFIAAVEIYQLADKYFPDVKRDKPWKYEIIKLPKAMSVKDILAIKAIKRSWFKKHNPALTPRAHRGRELLPKGFTIRVPPKQKAKVEKKLAYVRKHKSKRRFRKFTELPAPLYKSE